jgi:hypothetical protein
MVGYMGYMTNNGIRMHTKYVFVNEKIKYWYVDVIKLTLPCWLAFSCDWMFRTLTLGRDLVLLFCCRKYLVEVFLLNRERVVWIWYKTIVACRFQRPPGVIPSSMLGLETVTGSLDHFGFEDFLNGDMTFLSSFFSCLAIFTSLFSLAESMYVSKCSQYSPQYDRSLLVFETSGFSA